MVLATLLKSDLPFVRAVQTAQRTVHNRVLRQALVAVIDWKMDIQSALSQPHFAARGKHAELEKDTPATRLEGPLEDLGHKVKVRTLTSGLHGIEVMADGDSAWITSNEVEVEIGK